jgi:hypothetical protein
MDDRSEKKALFGIALIKQAHHTYDDILKLFTTRTNNCGEYLGASYHEYAPKDPRERLFFLLILLSKLNQIEKCRTNNVPLDEYHDWLEKRHVINDILSTKQIIDMTSITYLVDIDAACDHFYEEIMDSNDWEDWKQPIGNIDFTDIDKQMEDIRAEIFEQENDKSKFREAENIIGPEKFIDTIREYLTQKNLLGKVKNAQANKRQLSRQIASEVFHAPERAESVRQRLITISEEKE